MRPPVAISLPAVLCGAAASPAALLEAVRQPHAHLCAASRTLLDSRCVKVAAITQDLPPVPGQTRLDSRNNRLIMATLAQLQPQLDALLSRHHPKRIGVILGSSTSGVSDAESAWRHHAAHGGFPASFHYDKHAMGSGSALLAAFLGLQGPAYTVSTACSSGAKALASAAALIRSGACDAVLTGAADTLCELTLEGFAALGALSTDHCRPFSADRQGINLGEGCALFILEKGDGPVLFAGAGASSDAHHVSAPHPAGLGAAAAMRAALADAALGPEAITYLNLHGTATALNDSMEAAAVQAVFPAGLPCSSTKPVTGHALGAAGAIEAAIIRLLLAEDAPLLPPQWPGDADPLLPSLALVRPGQAPQLKPAAAMMSSSFAFGGSNAAIILQRSLA